MTKFFVKRRQANMNILIIKINVEREVEADNEFDALAELENQLALENSLPLSNWLLNNAETKIKRKEMIKDE